MESTKQEAKSESSNKIGLWIGLGIGAFVLVVGIVAAVILVPQMMRPDYQKTYDAVVELEEELNHYFYNSACGDVEAYVDDEYTGIDEYSEYIKVCRDEAENMYVQVAKFESESGVTRDSELSALYDKFRKAFDKKAPGKDQIESTLRIYAAMHGFVVGVEELDDDSDDFPAPSEFATVSNYLVDSDNEVLKEFAEGLTERYGALYEAAQAYLKANHDDGDYMELYDAYLDASDEFMNYYNEQSDILERLEVFLADSSDDEPSVIDAFDDLQAAIAKKAN